MVPVTFYYMEAVRVIGQTELRIYFMLGLELDVEWFDNGFGGSSEDVFAPQALLLVGTWIYAAGGLGVYFTDGDFANDPFFVLRAGLNLELLPSLYFDFNVNYRFEEWEDLQDRGTNIDSDTVMRVC